jgi:DNA-binding MarR family transcriptional regulator
MNERMKDAYRRLPNLFFVTRQLIRSKVRSAGKSGHNSWMRLETLRYIGEHRESTMRDIATYLRITAPSATSLIAGLARRKLIARERDKKDKRITRLRLSREGRAMLSAYEKGSSTLMKEVFSKLDAADIRELVRILKALDGHHRG